MCLPMDTSLPCDPVQQYLCQKVNVVPQTVQDLVASDQSVEKAQTHCGASSCHLEARGPKGVVSDTSRAGSSHEPSQATLSEDCSTDLRIVKHKPSAIVFCDHDLSSEGQAGLKESSDSGGSSSSTTEDGERQDDNDEDDFPRASQHKEFLVSRRRRVLSRNRKSLRKRPDAYPKGTASSSWRNPANEGKPEVTGGREDSEAGWSDGRQVRQKQDKRQS